MMSDAICSALRAEAEACRQSARSNGEYNAAFWVAAIVLDGLAGRLAAQSSGVPPLGSERSDDQSRPGMPSKTGSEGN